MSEPRRLAGFSPAHLLVLVAVAELSITRLAVPTLAPKPKDSIPTWYVALDNLGLFLLYFGTTLALAILLVRAWQMLRDRSIVGSLFGAALAVCALFAVVDVVITPSEGLSFLFHTAWALALVAILIAAIVRRRDVAITIGICVFALPLLVHYGAVLIAHFTSDDEAVDGIKASAKDWGIYTMVFAALLSPYLLSPRPAMRAIGKITPILVACLIGALGAVLERREYKAAMDLASNGVGVDLMPGVSNNDMALYLLALATLAWTFISCAIAESEARREVGMGVGLIVLGGYGFVWPMHFLLPVVGLLVMFDASARVKEEETPRAARPRTPPIDDDAWQTWIAALGDALRSGDAELKIVTVRGEDDTAQTVLVGERNGVPFKARFGRMMGALVAIDVIAGREVPETQRATFTLYARPDDGRELHPQPPPAAPSVQLDDTAFAQRFRVRGDAAVVTAVLDDALRARTTAMLDGWVAWWAGSGLRWRVYPSVGAPLDHPVPIADLATKGVGQVERMTGVIDVITAAAARGLEGVKDEPAVLE